MSSIEAGDIYVKRIELRNKTTSAFINPTDQIVGFDIWEDITKPTMYAEFLINDSISLLETFPIIGEETIRVELQTPSLDSVVYSFRCFEIGDVKRDANGKSKTYVMKCVSEEHLHNGSSLITQSYQDVISNIVPSILTQYLKTKKAVFVDETKGINMLAIPKLTPLETIDMCRQRAVSKQYASSAYVFFENQSGFVFKTIEGLIKEGRNNIRTRIFNAQQNVMFNKQSQANAYRTILDYAVISLMDSNKKTSEGIFKATTNTFDIATKQFTTTNFDLKTTFNKFENPDKKQYIPNSDAFIDKFGSGTPKQFFTPKNTLADETFIDSIIAARNSYTQLMNSDVTRVMVHGDTGLRAGDLVTLDLPEASGLSNRKGPDKMSSSNYLIIRLRHVVDQSTRSKHRVVFDCVKMGM